MSGFGKLVSGAIIGESVIYSTNLIILIYIIHTGVIDAMLTFTPS